MCVCPLFFDFLGPKILRHTYFYMQSFIHAYIHIHTLFQRQLDGSALRITELEQQVVREEFRYRPIHTFIYNNVHIYLPNNHTSYCKYIYNVLHISLPRISTILQTYIQTYIHTFSYEHISGALSHANSRLSMQVRPRTYIHMYIHTYSTYSTYVPPKYNYLQTYIHTYIQYLQYIHAT